MKNNTSKNWLKVGDRVTIRGEVVGTITKVRKDVGMPYYIVLWDNGHKGFHGLCSGLKVVQS